jgi:ammonia channel protein AmtB
MDLPIDPRIVAFAGPPPLNIDLDANTATSDRAAIIVVLILALVAILLRFTARAVQRTRVHLDDWIIVLGLILVGGTAGLAIAGMSQTTRYTVDEVLIVIRWFLRSGQTHMGRRDG